MIMRATIRQGLVWLVIAGAIVAAVATLRIMGRNAVTDVQLMQLRWQIGQWHAGQAPLPSITEWGRARNALAEGLRQTPDDPQIYEAMGYLYALQALSAAKQPTLFVPLMRQVKAYFENAGRLQPMSGTHWGNIALAQHLLVNVDASTNQKALARLWDIYDQALSFGSQDSATQRILVDIGTVRWNQMTASRRMALEKMIKNAWPDQKEALLIIAKKYDWMLSD